VSGRSALAERALRAYGGAERWRAAETIEFTVSIRSLIPRLKRRRRYPGLVCTADAHRPRIRIRHFEERDLVAILDARCARPQPLGPPEQQGLRREAWFWSTARATVSLHFEARRQGGQSRASPPGDSEAQDDPARHR
jgi:hypothetical protein